MSGAVIVAEGLQLALGGAPVIRNFSGVLDGGEVIGLLGANGSGKSTLLRLLAGLQQPDAGDVSLYQRQLADWPARERARQIAWLDQQRYCPWPLRAEELVALGRLPQRAPWAGLGEEDRNAIRQVLAACEIEHLAGRDVTRLSGGELARVLLARTLAVGADCVLADEPIAGLDPAHQLHVMEILRAQAHQQGRAVLVVLHDLTLAHRYCDRLWLLDQGSLIAAGPSEDVLSDDNLARAFGISVIRDVERGLLQPMKRLP